MSSFGYQLFYGSLPTNVIEKRNDKGIIESQLHPEIFFKYINNTIDGSVQ